MSDLTIPAAHAQRLRPLVLAAVDFTDMTADGDHRRQVAAFTLAGQLAGLIAMEDERQTTARISWGSLVELAQLRRPYDLPGLARTGSTPVNPDPVTNGGETPMT